MRGEGRRSSQSGAGVSGTAGGDHGDGHGDGDVVAASSSCSSECSRSSGCPRRGCSPRKRTARSLRLRRRGSSLRRRSRSTPTPWRPSRTTGRAPPRSRRAPRSRSGRPPLSLGRRSRGGMAMREGSEKKRQGAIGNHLACTSSPGLFRRRAFHHSFAGKSARVVERFGTSTIPTPHERSLSFPHGAANDVAAAEDSAVSFGSGGKRFMPSSGERE